MNRHWEAQTRNHSLVMVNVRFTTQRRAPAVDEGLCFCLDINKRRKRVEPTEHLAKPHPPPQQRLAGCSDSSLSPSVFLYASLPPSLFHFSLIFFFHLLLKFSGQPRTARGLTEGTAPEHERTRLQNKRVR